MRAPGLEDLIADPHRGVERGQRALHDHADVPSADRAHFPFGCAEQIAALKANLSGYAAAFELQEPQDGHGDCTLPGAAFAHQADDFPFIDFEFKPVQNIRIARIAGRYRGAEQRARCGHRANPASCVDF